MNTVTTTLNEVIGLKEVARNQDKIFIPVVKKIAADQLTSLNVYRAVTTQNSPSAFLESVREGSRVDRYSYIGINPVGKFVSKENISYYEYLQSDKQTEITKNPVSHLSGLLKKYSPLKVNKLPPFYGGGLGFIGFEAVTLVEPSIPRNTHDDLRVPDICLHFYDIVIVFDHAFQSLYIIKNIDITNGKIEELYREASMILKSLKSMIYNFNPNDKNHKIIGKSPADTEESNMTQEEYIYMVKKAKEYIEKGDVFQVVLSQRFRRDFTGSGLALYRVLRRINPSPYLFYLNLGNGTELIGASPEVMICVKDGVVTIRPIAGTLPRGANDKEDEINAQILQNDPKEIAEHKILADLARNDVGRVCKLKTVRVSGVMRIEKYSHVMHLVTDVTGELRDDVNSLTACLHSLPAGTLSGGPKIRSLQLIAEMEKNARGPYGGLVGWFTDKDIDTCIFIRSAIVKDGSIYFQSGGGIVTDSVPEKEYNESLIKSKGMKVSLDMMTISGGE